MNDSNLPQNFDKGNTLPQSPALIVSWLRNQLKFSNEPKYKFNATTALFAVVAYLIV